MGKRRALLIGVPEYDIKKMDLPIVHQDIDLLSLSLKKSKFEVRSPNVRDKIAILKTIRQECRETKGVETLLLYFSGHGIHYKDKDYLLPSDVSFDDPELLEDYLIPADLGDILGGGLDRCQAKTIIFCIDACREGVELAFKATHLNRWGTGQRGQVSKQRCVLVFACEKGQFSQYVSGHEGFSLFTKALSEVLDPQHPAITLREVLDGTQERLNYWADEKKKKRQKIKIPFETSVDDDTFLRIICEGKKSETAEEEIDPWSEAALQSSLWEMRDDDRNSLLAQFKSQVLRIIEACWQQWERGKRAFPEDPWRDDRFPVRMLELLSDLLVLRASVELTEAERALAIALPFVREAVLASAVVQAVKANPLTLEECKEKLGLREELERSHQGQPRFLRKAQRLQDRGRDREKDAVMAWLMHRCLLKTLEIWQPEAEGGYLADELVAALQDFGSCKSSLVQEALDRGRLIELARCTLVDAERIDRDDRPDALKDRISVGGYRNELEIREKMLAYLLKLAGLLAIDVRMLSDVLADHIGLADPLQPEAVVRTLNGTRWNPSGLGRVLSVVCPHPAIDLALGNHVEDADRVLRQVLRLVAEKRGGMEVLADLPTHLLGDAIEADRHKGVPVYQTPHVNFQLAHDEVRELLMGEQLYGDPTLAIRELYQNALDACRYRQARLKYLQQTGQYRGGNWEGRIVFRQDKDEKGREYIECEDNGIGMEMLHLSQCFARAGRRFADLPEFIEEKSDWLQCDPPIRLYPNSQFGVGVLSYFMLADEIEVETCRLDRKEFFGQKLKVRIPSSSGLFRVQPLGESRDSGTRIHLYLNRTHYDGRPISCLETLKKLLWVAEFKTTVEESNFVEVWNAGELKHPELPEDCCLNADHPDAWWVTKKGCFLADGLVTKKTSPCFVVNLNNSHRPKLTVDRKNIVECDQVWVNQILTKGWKPLVNWKHFQIEWLWSLEQTTLYIAEKIFNSLCQEDFNIKVSKNTIYIEIEIRDMEVLSYFYQKNINNKILKYLQEHEIEEYFFPLRSIGCFYQDQELSILQNNLIYDYRKMMWQYCWWMNLLQQKSFRVKNTFKVSNKINLIKRFPIPAPGDTYILLGKSEDAFKIKDTDTMHHKADHIVRIALELNKTISEILQRLRDFLPIGIKTVRIDPLYFKDYYPTNEDILVLSKAIYGYDFEIKPERSTKRNINDEKVYFSYLLVASFFSKQSLDRVLIKLQKFSILGTKIPKINPFILDLKG